MKLLFVFILIIASAGAYIIPCQGCGIFDALSPRNVTCPPNPKCAPQVKRNCSDKRCLNDAECAQHNSAFPYCVSSDVAVYNLCCNQP
uniref:Uncharacterized protein n=1 Tax=Panagrolaimus sp. JU765 TaxID=591449 RepID=A0AC34PVI6_9BILA